MVVAAQVKHGSDGSCFKFRVLFQKSYGLTRSTQLTGQLGPGQQWSTRSDQVTFRVRDSVRFRSTIRFKSTRLNRAHSVRVLVKGSQQVNDSGQFSQRPGQLSQTTRRFDTKTR
ncbi:hypothetical protein HanRHA438_Chr09g0387981 [Helianthus annuus]|nr:hypothetical protein HanRHA438_Chr09g0387981 [Helianthus annuus]